MQKLERDFYIKDVLTVAKNLLGKIFVYNDKRINKILSAKIVEVEAYNGRTDEAAHTFNGKTERNKIMFEQGGYLYVYFTYGIHFCANVVTGKEGEGTAVLLRGMEPLDGIDYFTKRRFPHKNNTDKKNLLNGPAKICQAFKIAREQNGTDLLGNEIYLFDAPEIPESKIVKTKRIGIKKSTELPWRFYIKDSIYVSKK
jgi:DNA-3-methyladenine glycosylase